MSKVKVGVIGLKIGRGHAICYNDYIADAELTAIAERAGVTVGYFGRVKSEDFCDNIGVKRYEEGMDMIRNEQLDALSLCVSPKYRIQLLEEAAKRGMAILMEKPMSCSSQDAQKILDIINKYNVLFMMEYPFRYFPAMVELKKIVDSGILGDIISVSSHLQTDYNPPRNHWMWDPQDGNGLLNEYVTHAFDNINYICGKPVSVYAVGRDYKGQSDMEDSAVMTFKYENGVTVMLNAGGYSTQAFKNPTYIHVYGTKGEARVTGSDWMYTDLMYAANESKAPWKISFAPPERFELMEYNLRHFVECVKERKKPSCGFEDGLTAVKMAEAVRESCRTGLPQVVR